MKRKQAFGLALLLVFVCYNMGPVLASTTQNGEIAHDTIVIGSSTTPANGSSFATVQSRVYNKTTNQPIIGAAVLFHFDSAWPQYVASASTNNGGYATTNVTSNLQGSFSYSANTNQSGENLTNYGYVMFAFNSNVKPKPATNPPPTAAQPGPTSRTSPAAPSAQSVQPSQASSPDPLAALSAPTLQNVTAGTRSFPPGRIVSSQLGQTITIRGSTIPKGVIKLYIFSTPREATVTADASGNWQYEVSDLPKGKHHIEAETTDPSTSRTSPRAKLINLEIIGPVAYYAGPTKNTSSNLLPIYLMAALALMTAAVLVIKRQWVRQKLNGVRTRSK